MKMPLLMPKWTVFWFVITASWPLLDAASASVRDTIEMAMEENPGSIKGDSLTDAQKTSILQLHNAFRSIVKPTASNMLRMSWDKELETIAGNFASKCIVAHNPDRHKQAKHYDWVGENIAWGNGFCGDKECGDVFEGVKRWFSESNNYNFITGQCSGKCTLYTQMTWWESDKLGCGAKRCGERTILVCNYAPGGNYVGQKPYRQGKPCSECPKGSLCDNNLCVPKEQQGNCRNCVNLGPTHSRQQQPIPDQSPTDGMNDMQQQQQPLQNTGALPLPGGWHKLPVNLIQVDSGTTQAVWGINPSSTPFCVDLDNVLSKVNGTLHHVSAGGAGVWGIGLLGNIFLRIGITEEIPKGLYWKRVHGNLKQIDSGPPGVVWGVNRYDRVFCRIGISPQNPAGTGWRLIEGSLKYISCGAYGCWGTDKQGTIYFRRGVTANVPQGTDWIVVQGSLRMIESGPLGVTVGVRESPDGIQDVLYRSGVTRDKPEGMEWVKLQIKLSHVTVGQRGIFGIMHNGAVVLHRDLQLLGEQGPSVEPESSYPTEATPLEAQDMPLMQHANQQLNPTVTQPTQPPPTSPVKAVADYTNGQPGTNVGTAGLTGGPNTGKAQEKDPMKISPDMANKILHMIQEKSKEFEGTHKAAAQQMQKNINDKPENAQPTTGVIVAEKTPNTQTQSQASPIRNATITPDMQPKPNPLPQPASAAVSQAPKPFQDALISNQTAAANLIPQNTPPKAPPQNSQPSNAAAQNSVPQNSTPKPATKATSDMTNAKANASSSLDKAPVGAQQAAAPQNPAQAASSPKIEQGASQQPSKTQPPVNSQQPSAAAKADQDHVDSQQKKLPSNPAPAQFANTPKVPEAATTTNNHQAEQHQQPPPLQPQQQSPPPQQPQAASATQQRPPASQQQQPIGKPPIMQGPPQKAVTDATKTTVAPTQLPYRPAPQLFTATRPENIHHVATPTHSLSKTTPFEFFKNKQSEGLHQFHQPAKGNEQVYEMGLYGRKHLNEYSQGLNGITKPTQRPTQKPIRTAPITQAVTVAYELTRSCCAIPDSVCPIPRDCTGYIECKGYNGFYRNCERGKMFHPFKNICDYPRNVDCETIKVGGTLANTRDLQDIDLAVKNAAQAPIENTGAQILTEKEQRQPFNPMQDHSPKESEFLGLNNPSGEDFPQPRVSTPRADNGGVLREVWFGLGLSPHLTELIKNPRFPTTPDEYLVLDKFEAPPNAGDGYGQRLSSYFKAPVTGKYAFSIACDNECELWISPDTNELNSNLTLELKNGHFTSFRQWDKYPNEQISQPIFMMQGKFYFIESFMKEGTGGDNLSIGVRFPGGETEMPIVNNLFLIPSGLNRFASSNKGPKTDSERKMIIGSNADAMYNNLPVQENYLEQPDRPENIESNLDMFNTRKRTSVRRNTE